MELKELRRERKKYYLTQYDVCRYIGVSDIAYRTWERMVRRPKEEHWKRLNYVFTVLEGCSGEIKDRNSAILVLEREFGDDE